MEMFNPPHPGEIVREDCIVASGLSVTEAAAQLGVSRQSMSELINGRNGISADMALRLEKAGWGDALSWLRNQASYDLWQARHREETPPPRARFKVRAHGVTVASSATEEDIVAAVAAATKPEAARKAAARKAALKKKAREAARKAALKKKASAQRRRRNGRKADTASPNTTTPPCDRRRESGGAPGFWARSLLRDMPTGIVRIAPRYPGRGSQEKRSGSPAGWLPVFERLPSARKTASTVAVPWTALGASLSGLGSFEPSP